MSPTPERARGTEATERLIKEQQQTITTLRAALEHDKELGNRINELAKHTHGFAVAEADCSQCRVVG